MSEDKKEVTERDLHRAIREAQRELFIEHKERILKRAHELLKERHPKETKRIFTTD